MEQGQVYLPDTVMENLWAKNQLFPVDTSKFKNVWVYSEPKIRIVAPIQAIFMCKFLIYHQPGAHKFYRLVLGKKTQ